jgi:hypothetical protein
VLAWVRAEASGAKLVYATGLLSVILEDREIADYVVRSELGVVLLRRLKEERLSPQAAERAGEGVASEEDPSAPPGRRASILVWH